METITILESKEERDRKDCIVGIHNFPNSKFLVIRYWKEKFLYKICATKPETDWMDPKNHINLTEDKEISEEPKKIDVQYLYEMTKGVLKK